MKVTVRCYLEVTIDFPDAYPNDLTEIKEWAKEKYGMVGTPTIKNLLGGNRVILVGEIAMKGSTIKRQYTVPPL